MVGGIATVLLAGGLLAFPLSFDAVPILLAARLARGESGGRIGARPTAGPGGGAQ